MQLLGFPEILTWQSSKAWKLWTAKGFVAWRSSTSWKLPESFARKGSKSWTCCMEDSKSCNIPKILLGGAEIHETPGLVCMEERRICIDKLESWSVLWFLTWKRSVLKFPGSSHRRGQHPEKFQAALHGRARKQKIVEDGHHAYPRKKTMQHAHTRTS